MKQYEKQPNQLCVSACVFMCVCECVCACVGIFVDVPFEVLDELATGLEEMPQTFGHGMLADVRRRLTLIWEQHR